jgi:putative oxidoreductase
VASAIFPNVFLVATLAQPSSFCVDERHRAGRSNEQSGPTGGHLLEKEVDMAIDVAAIDIDSAPYGALMLRLCLAAMFIAHAMLKWRVYTIPVEAEFFRSLGLPGWVAPLTVTIELSGAGCLVLGIFARWAALLLIPLILGTIVTVHGKNGWLFTNKDGGWEYPAFWAAALFVQFLLGDGAWTLIRSPALRALG